MVLRKKYIALAIFVILVGASAVLFFAFREESVSFLSESFNISLSQEETELVVDESSKDKIVIDLKREEERDNASVSQENLPEVQINTSEVSPKPIAENTNRENGFSVQKIINITNEYRATNELPPLLRNDILTRSAVARVQDMLVKQYFSHDAPDGKNAQSFIEGEGYKIIAIGENIAYGNYKNERDLVNAWINSPPHREVILNGNFEDIGVAVVKGRFEGRDVWMATQHFGRSIKSCDSVAPNESLGLEVKNKVARLESVDIDRSKLKNEIDSFKDPYGAEYDKYEALVNKYNSLVEQYNALLVEAEIMADEYNSQVRVFNDCVKLR